jgi:hypothetical protein
MHAGVGVCLGSHPRAKVSMMIMRPPQQGHGHGSTRCSSVAVGSDGWGSFEGDGVASNSRARAMLAARLPSPLPRTTAPDRWGSRQTWRPGQPPASLVPLSPTIACRDLGHPGDGGCEVGHKMPCPFSPSSPTSRRQRYPVFRVGYPRLQLIDLCLPIRR